MCGRANRSQGSRRVRAGAEGVPTQSAGAGARARDAPAFALRPARGSPQDQKPPRPAPPHQVGNAPPHAWGGRLRKAKPGGGDSPTHCLGMMLGFGDYGGGETPVPFPNTVVKPSSADGTVGVTRWESRSLPSVLISPAARKGHGTCFLASAVWSFRPDLLRPSPSVSPSRRHQVSPGEGLVRGGSCAPAATKRPPHVGEAFRAGVVVFRCSGRWSASLTWCARCRPGRSRSPTPSPRACNRGSPCRARRWRRSTSSRPW